MNYWQSVTNFGFYDRFSAVAASIGPALSSIRPALSRFSDVVVPVLGDITSRVAKVATSEIVVNGLLPAVAGTVLLVKGASLVSGTVKRWDDQLMSTPYGEIGHVVLGTLLVTSGIFGMITARITGLAILNTVAGIVLLSDGKNPVSNQEVSLKEAESAQRDIMAGVREINQVMTEVLGMVSPVEEFSRLAVTRGETVGRINRGLLGVMRKQNERRVAAQNEARQKSSEQEASGISGGDYRTTPESLRSEIVKQAVGKITGIELNMQNAIRETDMLLQKVFEQIQDVRKKIKEVCGVQNQERTKEVRGELHQEVMQLSKFGIEPIPSDRSKIIDARNRILDILNTVRQAHREAAKAFHEARREFEKRLPVIAFLESDYKVLSTQAEEFHLDATLDVVSNTAIRALQKVEQAGRKATAVERAKETMEAVATVLDDATKTAKSISRPVQDQRTREDQTVPQSLIDETEKRVRDIKREIIGTDPQTESSAASQQKAKVKPPRKAKVKLSTKKKVARG